MLLSERSEENDPSRADVFGRNAYHYIAEGATCEFVFAGRGRMLNTLRENDDNFKQNVMAEDHMGKTAVDFLMQANKKNQFLSSEQIDALRLAQLSQ